jgi:hypothetical protein
MQSKLLQLTALAKIPAGNQAGSMSRLDLAKKHARDWAHRVLDLVVQAEDLGLDPVKVIEEAIEK